MLQHHHIEQTLIRVAFCCLEGIMSKCHLATVQEFSERRHLLRLWIAPPVERPLPDAYLEIYGGSVEIGSRGGIKVAGYKATVPLEAE